MDEVEAMNLLQDSGKVSSNSIWLNEVRDMDEQAEAAKFLKNPNQ